MTFWVAVGEVDAGVAVGFCVVAGVEVGFAVAVGVAVGAAVGEGVCVGVAVGAGDACTVAAVDWLEVAPKLSVTVAVIAYEPVDDGEKLNVEPVCPCWAAPFTYHW